MRLHDIEVFLTKSGPEINVRVDETGRIWDMKIYCEALADYIEISESTLAKYVSAESKVEAEIQEWLNYRKDGWREDEEAG